MAIILRLDRIMADRKISLTELSERVGISMANLSNLKTGKVRAIRFSTLDAICRAVVATATTQMLTAQVQQMNANYANAIGWIYVPDTHINYPVMQSEDNDFYLHHGADGGYLYAGSIFLDYRCNADFSGVSNILYGHNMSNRSMFADVTNFTDRTYFDSHRYGWLTTENDVYCVCFFAVDVTENTGEIYNTDSSWRTVMSEAVNRAVIYDDIEIADTDRLVMLSTCTGANSSSRTVLVGKIMEDENI